MMVTIFIFECFCFTISFSLISYYNGQMGLPFTLVSWTAPMKENSDVMLLFIVDL